MRTPLFAAILCFHGVVALAQEAPTVYHGACDGSAAVALDDRHFVAANDDENSLRLYRIGVSNPLAVIDLNPTLGPKKKDDGTFKEVDIEAAARIGDRIYWLGSHARDKHAGKESSRHRFFATDIGKAQGGVPPFILRPKMADVDLLEELIVQLPLLPLEKAAKRAPEDKEGFNIEGLAAAPGGELMIGLRNPRPNDLALVIPFTNPAAVIDDKKAKPRFGTPERLYLGKRGIRSIEYVGERYVIVAGPFGDKDNDFAIYTWSGPGSVEQPKQDTTVKLGDLKPEALFATANPKEVYLLSDDGSDACKKLKDPNQKTFRGLAVRLAN